MASGEQSQGGQENHGQDDTLLQLQARLHHEIRNHHLFLRVWISRLSEWPAADWHDAHAGEARWPLEDSHRAVQEHHGCGDSLPQRPLHTGPVPLLPPGRRPHPPGPGQGLLCAPVPQVHGFHSRARLDFLCLPPPSSRGCSSGALSMFPLPSLAPLASFVHACL